MNIDTSLLRSKTAEYAAEHAGYVAYAAFLDKVLRKAAQRLAPMATVEARAKSESSYAEKVVRKQDKFADPAYRITDCCGARVITQTAREKAMFCDYVRRNFAVDEKNSEDTRSKLKDDQFGYLSYHYVVQIKVDDLQLEGIAVPPEVKTGPEGFKAEIQVRTVSEHAWASTMHDRIYKVGIKPPTMLKRQAAALAATMEEADQRFTLLTESIDQYLGNYCATMDAGQMDAEVKILQSARDVLKAEDQDARAALTLRLARLMRLAGDLALARKELESVDPDLQARNPAMRLELGHTLVLLHRREPHHPDFVRGQDLLRCVAEESPDPREPMTPARQAVRAEAAHQLAWSHTLLMGKECDAREWYREALTRDPRNPYYLAAYLEYEAYCRREHNFFDVMRPMLEQAIGTCRDHVAVGIEIPRAHFTIGRLFVLLGDTSSALAAYSKAIRVALDRNSTVKGDVFDGEIEFLKRINFGQSSLPDGHEAVRRLFLLAQALKSRGAGVCAWGETARDAETIRASGKDTVLIVAGGARGMDKSETQRHAHVIETILTGFDGIVCSGGTGPGVSGMVGDVAARLKEAGRKRFLLLGCVSESKEPRDPRYDRVFVSDGKSLSELEPLHVWTALIDAGIRPEQVCLLGINGGRIAGFEYRLALALGARVGVVAHSGRAADALLADADWAGDSNLLCLPLEILEPATLHALTHPGGRKLQADTLDELGRIVHENYLAQTPYSAVDPVRKPWKELREDYKTSNRHQIAYAVEILASEGYLVREAEGTPAVTLLKEDEINRMAVLEHGRWNIERLGSGWTYGPKKDPDRKISPYLCAWDKLPPEIQEYDRAAIRNYVAVLAQAGLEVVKAPSVMGPKNDPRAGGAKI